MTVATLEPAQTGLSAYHARRRDETRERALEATRALLNLHGLRGLTVEAVAEYSGLAKTTIYRQWPNALDLAVDALVGDAADARAVARMVNVIRELAAELAVDTFVSDGSEVDGVAACEVLLAAAQQEVRPR